MLGVAGLTFRFVFTRAHWPLRAGIRCASSTVAPSDMVVISEFNSPSAEVAAAARRKRGAQLGVGLRAEAGAVGNRGARPDRQLELLDREPHVCTGLPSEVDAVLLPASG